MTVFLFRENLRRRRVLVTGVTGVEFLEGERGVPMDFPERERDRARKGWAVESE